MTPSVEPGSIDERLLNHIIKRTGGAKEVFRKIKDESTLDGWENQQIFKACKNIYNKAKPKTRIGGINNIAPDLVREELSNMGVLPKINVDKLNRIFSYEPATRDLDVVIKMMSERDFGLKTDKLAMELSNTKDPEKRAQLLEEMHLAEKYRASHTEDKLLSQDDWILGVDNIENLPECIPTGFPLLDENIGGGFIKGNYHIISSPSGSGKTILMLSMWKHLLDIGVKSVYVNYEIPRDLFMKYLFAQLTGVNVYRKDIDPEEIKVAKEYFKEKVFELYEQDLLLISDPESGSSNMWTDMEDMIKDLVEVKGAECIWFDTINSINTKTKSGQNLRWNEYESIAMSAEFICRELNLPIVFSAQMDRDVMKRDEKTPKLGDVSGSKVLTEKAATIVHLHRSDLADETRQIDYSELHVTKNRVIGQDIDSKPIRIKYDNNYKKLYELPKGEQETERVPLSDFEGPFIIPHPVMKFEEG